jgi:hypothetical protein
LAVTAIPGARSTATLAGPRAATIDDPATDGGVAESEVGGNGDPADRRSGGLGHGPVTGEPGGSRAGAATGSPGGGMAVDPAGGARPGYAGGPGGAHRTAGEGQHRGGGGGEVPAAQHPDAAQLTGRFDYGAGARAHGTHAGPGGDAQTLGGARDGAPGVAGVGGPPRHRAAGSRPVRRAAAAAGRRAAPRRRLGRRVRGGIVVPLRVPWTTRLRAVVGLAFLVIVLGTTTALVVAALVVAVAQALSGL